ncbi:MAG TPA: hypothetical protein VGP63_02240 [Planctomycetaceae bacterium]|jgi:hypothetical protein|nr:hypothetical protein [Planctomycetaceae bacterium]
MPDPNHLNDPELERLERRLSRLTWPPTENDRERLLYACGQAAGRAQMLRRVRGVTAIAAILACVCAGLGFALLRRDASPVAVADPVPTQLPDKSVASPHRDVVSREAEEDGQNPESPRGRELSVLSFGDLALLDQKSKTSQFHGDISTSGTARVMSAAGPLGVEL